MTNLEMLITLLCSQCLRRGTECKSPTWADAYKCQFDEADALGLTIKKIYKDNNW